MNTTNIRTDADKLISECESAVKEYISNPDQEKTLFFQVSEFTDAIFIRDYLENHYADIPIFIEIDGFIYGTEIRHLREECYEQYC